MFSKDMRRAVIALSLAMLCFAPVAAQAATRGTAKIASRTATVRQEGVLQAFWRGIAQLFEKEGAGIDPTGLPGVGSGTGSCGTDDEGAGIDPTGAPNG